jgi:rod shape determining protein RodA
MWDHRYLSRIDLRIIPIVLCLMLISLLVISSMTGEEAESIQFWTPTAKAQLRWCCLGWSVFFAVAMFDYRKLREWSFLLYVLTIFLLVGLFFVNPIQNVHRWYKIGSLMNFQPSEHAKLVVVLALSWFLERQGSRVGYWGPTLQAAAIVLVPFALILKQPDLGTSLVLLPMGLVVAYFGGVHAWAIRGAVICGAIGLTLAGLIFLGVLSHEEMRPFATTVVKEYQYERLNPNTYHQRAAQTAIAIGGLTGTGWHKSEFSARKWLPAAHTDSVFAAFGEEFGWVGVAFLLFLFYALIYCGVQVALVARDAFGRLLAAGLAAYFAMHTIANIAMMCALLPISGVPLLFVTYGGSSLVTTMAALGLLQSIYSRRFMF